MDKNTKPAKGAKKKCDCINIIRKKLEEHHMSAVSFDLKTWINMKTMKTEAGLPPLNYSYQEGKKWKKGYVAFLFCPFCGDKKD